MFADRRDLMSVLRRAVALLLVGVLFGCGSTAGPPADSAVADLHVAADQVGDRTLADLARDSRLPSCLDQDSTLQAALDKARTSPNALLVVRNVSCGTSVYLSGDASTATRASLWRIGSVTKTYVAATVLALLAAGKLALDDPLSTWVPGVAKTDGVTLKMLLNHTSGIFNYTADASFGSDPSKVWTPKELVALATAHDPYFAPGAGWKYSNTNYVLLGMVIEAAGAATAGALIRKHALVPAGLSHTFLDGEETLADPLARGFDANGKDVTYTYHPSGPWTAGAIAATGADLCDWVAALYGDTKVLDATRLKLMVDGAVAASATEKYGLGVELLDASITAGAGPAMGHGGAIAGFNTQAFWFPDKKTAICSIVNRNDVSANDVTLAALLALFK
jgi:D-alanyl-D-alanine carboxypeptidase